MPTETHPRGVPHAGCLAPRRATSVTEAAGGRYSRLFPDLPPLTP
jgi:hypothetical protein